MKPRLFQSLILAAVTLLGFPAAAQAEKYFTYQDSNGVIVFTNIQPGAGKAAKDVEVRGNNTLPDTGEIIRYDNDKHNLFDDLIAKACQDYGVDVNLVKAVIFVESRFSPYATSPKGAMGLMQLMPGTARRFGVVNAYDPEQNIRGGVAYLRYLIDMFDGDLPLVLSSYNAGENLVKKTMKVPYIRETINYVAQIQEIYGSSRTKIAEAAAAAGPPPPLPCFTFRDTNGVVTLTNVDPPDDAIQHR